MEREEKEREGKWVIGKGEENERARKEGNG